MPRAHKKTAAKDYPDAGIKKGDVYYLWTTRSGPYSKGVKHRQKTPPKRQQLTGSEFLRAQYDLEDRISALRGSTNLDDFKAEVDSIIEDIRSLGEEQQEKFDNMPDGLQQGSTGEQLQARAEACESWASSLEAVSIPDEEISEVIDGLVDELEQEGYSE